MDMKWFAAHPKASAITIIIVILIVFIFASSLLSKYDNPVGRGAGAVITAIQKPFVKGFDWVEEKVKATFTDDALRTENEALKAEVMALEDELASNRLDEAELEELRELRSVLADAGAPRGDFTFKAANILVFEGAGVFNVFTIDVGSDDGAARDTVVIAGDGLVGRVLEANTNSAKVIAIIDENNKIGFEIEGRPSELGICYGDGNGALAGNMLDDQADVQVGDRVITSGLGGIYPGGILVGVVTSAEFVKESSLLHVEIEPAVEFRNIRKVALLL